MRTISYFAAIVLFAIAPAALADNIQITINSSVQVTGGSPNANYWGEYKTLADALGTQSQVNANVPFASSDTTFSNVSFFLPVGSVITSATMNLILSTTPIVGTGSVSVAPETLSPPDLDPHGLHMAPTFNDPATSFFTIQEVLLQPVGDSAVFAGNFFPNSPIISGNEISTGTWDLTFEVEGQIIGTVNTPGYNWDGYIEGVGQIDIPYSVQVDVDYTITPEPPSFVLLGTAMTGLVGIVRRKWLPS